MNEIDLISIQFDEQALVQMNISLGIIMFGIALKLSPKNFLDVLRFPKSFLVGFASQFLLLPAITFGLVLLLQPVPSMALGMLLVASCPGGNISNFMTASAGGNAALSVSMTAVASLLAVVATPFNLALWGSQYAPTAAILQEVQINFFDVALIVATILVVPMALGMAVRHYFPNAADRMHGVIHILSLVIFGAFVVLAFRANLDNFMTYIHLVIGLVFLHNATALLTGFVWAKIFKVPEADLRTITIETGIQNSGLGLGLIFTFFNGLGGMAIVAGWWGIWHILSGLSLAFFWNQKGELAKT